MCCKCLILIFSNYWEPQINNHFCFVLGVSLHTHIVPRSTVNCFQVCCPSPSLTLPMSSPDSGAQDFLSFGFKYLHGTQPLVSVWKWIICQSVGVKTQQYTRWELFKESKAILILSLNIWLHLPLNGFSIYLLILVFWNSMALHLGWIFSFHSVYGHLARTFYLDGNKWMSFRWCYSFSTVYTGLLGYRDKTHKVAEGIHVPGDFVCPAPPSFPGSDWCPYAGPLRFSFSGEHNFLPRGRQQLSDKLRWGWNQDRESLLFSALPLYTFWDSLLPKGWAGGSVGAQTACSFRMNLFMALRLELQAL